VEIYGSPIQHGKESGREKQKYGKSKEQFVDDYSDERDIP